MGLMGLMGLIFSRISASGLTFGACSKEKRFAEVLKDNEPRHSPLETRHQFGGHDANNRVGFGEVPQVPSRIPPGKAGYGLAQIAVEKKEPRRQFELCGFN